MSLLPLIWILIIAFCIVMYVVLDGFTLGTGILLPFMNRQQRDLAMSVILPTWDGNQTWLVLGAASLYGAFPVAFSALLPVLYIPLLTMVLALLFRGVTFEFRLKAKSGIKNWDRIFTAASVVVTLIQGVVLGNFVEGFVFSEHPYIVSDRAFFTPFTVFTAISLIFGYSLLGSTRLILKTEGDLQTLMYKIAKIAAIALISCVFAVSIWTPFVNTQVFLRWFANNNWIYLGILPYMTLILSTILLWTLFRKNEIFPYWCTIGLFLCGYIGFIISLYPYIVPYKITLWEAASPDDTLMFILVGAIVMLPVLLIYTGYSYHVFRGKVKDVIKY